MPPFPISKSSQNSGDNRTGRLLDVQRTINACFLIVFVTTLFLFSRSSTWNTFQPNYGLDGRLFVPKPIARRPLETKTNILSVTNETALDKFFRMQNNYNAKLNSLVIRTYRPSSAFIQYGDPVGKFVPERSSRVKKILMWTAFFGDRHYIPQNLTCLGGLTCVSSSNRDELLSSDAVIIHARDIRSPADLPKQRLPHQRWVHFLLESPFHAGISFKSFDNVYNWTATYRRDSDVPSLYIFTYKLDHPLDDMKFNKVMSDLLSSKSRLAATMISNCYTPHSPRLGYLRELQTHLHLDRYGGCGNLSCPRSAQCDNTMKSYKFFMAFENSNCRDYITEKAGRPLYRWGSVPVVMGGSNPREYDNILPPGSYIHTAGFDSPKHLAEYLLLLDRNPHLYARYHAWRRTYSGSKNHDLRWCDLCVRLHNMSAPTQTYKDLAGWNEEDVCR